jgi:hypothetical protein
VTGLICGVVVSDEFVRRAAGLVDARSARRQRRRGNPGILRRILCDGADLRGRGSGEFDRRRRAWSEVRPIASSGAVRLSGRAEIVTIEHMFGLPLPEIARKWREMAEPGGDHRPSIPGDIAHCGKEDPAETEPEDERAPANRDGRR